MDRVHEAVAELNGTHDFKAFTLPSSLFEKPDNYPTLRQVEVRVEPGTSLLSAYMPPLVSEVDYWNFVFQSRSFLYRQVSKQTLLLFS